MAEIYFPRRSNKRKITQTGIQNKKYQPIQKKSRNSFIPIEPLTLPALTEGMVILGCVSKINEHNIIMSLPGCLVGNLSRGGISTTYTKLFNPLDKDPCVYDKYNKKKPAAPLQSMFKIGSKFPCKVMKVNKLLKSKNYSIELSIDPDDVNEDLQPSSLYYHMALYASVKSIEDHAYIMDVGIKGLTGCILIKGSFQNDTEDGGRTTLALGQVIPTIVISKSKDLVSERVVQLCPHPIYDPFPKVQKRGEINLNSLIPGMVVGALVKTATKQGLLVSCWNFEGCVHKDHINRNYDPDQFTDIEIIGTVLYVHPVTRIIHLSLYPKPSPGQFCKMFELFREHGIVESAVVTLVEKNCMYLNLGDFKGKLMKKHEGTISKAYPVNSTLRCEVRSLHPLDNIVQVSPKENNGGTSEEIKIGDICKGTVKRLVENGMLVSLKPNLQGFVRDIHMFDGPLVKPEALFTRGTKVLCRVLFFTTSPLRINLTCKKALMDSSYTVLSSYGDACPGLITKGVIVFIDEKYMLLSFYNEVQGIVPQKEFGPNCSNPGKSYFVGQVIKCRVTRCIPKDQTLSLSLKIGENPSSEYTVVGNVFEVGKIYDVLVKQKLKKKICVNLIGTSEIAYLPHNHLSDHLENCFILNTAYKINDKIRVLCFSNEGNTIVTKKFSLLQAAEKNLLCNKLSNIQVGKVLPGVVKESDANEMFVELGHNIKGHVSKKFLSDWAMDYSSFVDGQSVMAKVLRINYNQVELTTRVFDVYDGNPEYSLDFLQSFLEDGDMITEFYCNSDDVKKKLADLQVGSIVSAKIMTWDITGAWCELDSGVKGHAVKQFCGELSESSNFCNAVVLFIDFEKNFVELSFVTHLLKCIRRHKDEKSSEVKLNQILRCQVLFKTNDFILVVLEGHAIGRFAYLPSRRVLNDEVGRCEDYSLGDKYHIVVKRMMGNFILGVLKSHNKKYLSAKQNMDTNKYTVNSRSLSTSGSSQERSCAVVNDVLCEPNIDEEEQSPNAFQDETNNICENALRKCHKAVIKSVKKFQVNLVLDNGLQGRIHITKMGNFREGMCPMSTFNAGETCNVYIKAVLKKKHHKYLEFSHRRYVTYAECSLCSEPDSNSDCEITTGMDVSGFIKEIDEQRMVIWLTPNLTGEMNLLNFSHSAKDLRLIKRFNNIGQSVQATVKSIFAHNRSFSAGHCSIELTKFMTWKPKTGDSVAAQIQISSPDRGLIVKLGNEYHGTVAMTDLTDNFETAERALTKFGNKFFIQCYVVQVDHLKQFCILSTRSSRLYQSKAVIIDPELTAEDIAKLKVGNEIRGLVNSVTPNNLHVSLGRDLKVTVPNRLSSGDKANVKTAYKIGSVITVVVKENSEQSLLLSVV